MRCRYCGASNEVGGRQRSEKAGRVAPSMAEDVARLSRLKAQIEAPLTGHVYDLSQPPLGLTEPPDAGRLEWLEARWAEAKSEAAANGDPQTQHRLCWVAFRLADAYDEANRRDYERAVLETALERLADEGHRHLVRCRLALEAIGEGDVASAEGWLAECDPAPEVPELDSAYRRARAHVAAAKGDAAGVLGLVGRDAATVPIHPSQEAAIWRLRIHALEALGDPSGADAALAAALGALGKPAKSGGGAKSAQTMRVGAKWDGPTRDRFFAAMRKERLGLSALLRLRTQQRDRVAGGTSLALSWQLWWWPLRALLLFVVITIPRCLFDADPFLGVQGHLLCPSLCDDCRGPWRVYTYWTKHDDSASTGGPRYFCRSEGGSIEELSDEDYFYQVKDKSRYELHVAPAMSSYLFALAITLLWIPYGVRRSRRENDRRKEQLDQEIATIATAMGRAPPPPTPPPGRLRKALIVAAAAVLIPVAVILLELAVR